MLVWTDRMIHTIRMGITLVLLMTCAGSASVADDPDVNIIKNRILRPLLAREIDITQVERILGAQKPDGSWPDVDYRDMTRAGWKTSRHLSNLAVLVMAFQAPESMLRHRPELRQAVFAGLDYWLKHDFQNPNWWHNVIGVPRALGPLLLLLDSELSSEQRQRGIDILKRGQLGMNGQNLVWVAEVSIQRGILEGDPDLIHSAFQRIAAEIKQSRQEGIQYDFSFHQHGKCLYNHGYGSGFAVDCSRLAVLAARTRFAFSQDKIDLLASYVLDGSQWMAYGRNHDYGADGREIVRPRQTASYLQDAAGNLLQLSTDRAPELQTLAARMTKHYAPSSLEGNRHFWCSDIMTHIRKGYYSSARMYSQRLVNTDGPANSEGIKSHYIADGCNYLLVSGDEYQDIFPVWDWHRIPGTTVEQTGVFAGSPRRKGNRDFVGGVSNGQYGLAVFDLERDGLAAHKAWFFFDRQYVCLGAGISCGSRNQVLTTVNQCYLRGDVHVFNGDEEKILSQREHRLTSPLSIHHNQVAYIVNSDSPVLLRNAPQEGSWKLISSSASKRRISHEVFTLCLDHGTGPQNAAYAYTVCPAMDIHQAQVYAQDPAVDVLSNTADLQAVRHRTLRLAQVAFYRAGSLSLDRQTTVKVDRPCLMLIHQQGKQVRLTVSDPTQKLGHISVILSGRVQGGGCTYDPATRFSTVSLALPVGPCAGQSIGRTLRKMD
jgi:chondroitin AC lyase